MKKIVLLVLVCGLIASMVSAANALTVEYIEPIALAGLNWSGSNIKSVTIPLFDASGGKTLQSVTFVLLGHMEGIAAYESLDAMPTTITLSVASTIQLQKPDFSGLVTAAPSWSSTYSSAAEDGIVDWLGTSGATNAFAESRTETFVTTASADLAQFTGVGNIVLPVSAIATSVAAGSGNLVPWFETSASAQVTVRYDYIVPEPSALIALGTGIIGIVGLAFGRKY